MSSSGALSSTVAVMATGTALQGLAIFLTAWRLWYRLSTQRFWCDDAWALIAVVCGIMCRIAAWVRCRPSYETSVVGYWIATITFVCVIWAVRMSLLCSIARLMPPSKRTSHVLAGIIVLFALMFCGLLVQNIFKCRSSWYYLPSGTLNCPYSDIMAIYELTIDVLSDVILVALPLRILWAIKLRHERHRKVVFTTFSSNIIISFVSIFRTTCRLKGLSFLVLIGSELQLVCCDVVCSLLVAVTYLDSRLGNGDESDEETSGRGSDCPSQRYSTHLTTVDLEQPSGYEANSEIDSSKGNQSFPRPHTDLEHPSTPSQENIYCENP
ncbi:hypothetical protein BJ138DRAFT_825953 [Hygrophoropsis aurantiaca]|uniref:Uncharacterized protein n=1 Tax=Hygrophoropsis aurantiaca TaxID=72124 RepID=A0ACB8AQW7_9AGAM|nr:hypothetical protein BJ138DRAFT_825953 [Hygrophoropsis aurantiaca]